MIEVHGHAKQGAGFGYTKVRGLNALLATATTPEAAPVIVAQRLRRGACSSPRGGKRLVADAVTTTRRLFEATTPVLVRMDSAFYGRGPVHAALAGGAQVSVTVRADARVKAAIASIAEDAWTMIEYTDAVFDETSGEWISRAEVAEIAFTAFAAQPKSDQVPGRLIVRRIPDFQADKHRAAGQDGLFDVWRFHAFFTTTDPTVLDTVAADQVHRRHAIIEQVHADLKNSALAHLPSGVFTANAAWLVLAVIAFNLTRAAATLAAPAAASDLARATTATVRRTADSDSVPDRDLRTTTDPAPPAGLALADRLDPTQRTCRRPTRHRHQLTICRHPGPTDNRGTPWQRGQPLQHADSSPTTPTPNQDQLPKPIGGLRLTSIHRSA